MTGPTMNEAWLSKTAWQAATLWAAGIGLLMATPAAEAESRPSDEAPYRVDIDPKSLTSADRIRENKQVRSIGLQFQVRRTSDGKLDVELTAR